MNWHGMEPYVTLDLPAKWPWEEAMKRIRVPEEMLKAAQKAHFDLYEAHPLTPNVQYIPAHLEAALLWLSEHPQVPTDEQVEECRKLHRYEFDPMKPLSVYKAVAVEWQRRCFVQEEPEIPAEIEDLLVVRIFTEETAPYQPMSPESVNEKIKEAYRRGLRKGEQK